MYDDDEPDYIEEEPERPPPVKKTAGEDEEEDELEENSDAVEEPAEAATTVTPTAAGAAVPGEPSPKKRKLAPGEQPPAKRSGRAAFELPSNPDERTEHFLKNPEKRQAELTYLLHALLGYASKAALWEALLRQHSGAAHRVLTSYQRHAKRTTLTEFDAYLRWLAYVQHSLPPPPKYLPPLDLTLYHGVILKAWDVAAHSPYARDSTNARFVPNFVSIALAVLYCMAAGGYSHDCSLAPADLPLVPAEFEALDLRTLQVNLLPPGTKLAPHLLPVEELPALRGSLTRPLKIVAKQRSKGWRSLKECFATTVEQYRQQLRESLAAGAEPSAALTAYIRQCYSLSCRV